MWFVFRSSEAKAKSQVKNADSTKPTSRDAVTGGDCGGNEVKQRTQDDSMINTDSAAQRRQKPTSKRRLASFRLLTHCTQHAETVNNGSSRPIRHFRLIVCMGLYVRKHIGVASYGTLVHM